jgi:cell division protein FtsQ
MAREKKSAGGFRWRLWLAVTGLALACASTAIAGFKVRAYMTSDARFMLSRDRQDALRIEGLRYASRSKAMRVFAGDFGHSIFEIPIAERRRRLLGIDWVEDASVSRVWPDRLVVRIRERKPVAFAAFRYGALLVDAEGVLMEPPMGVDLSYPVLRGLKEEETEGQRRERVALFLRFEKELGEYARDISEVDVADPEGLRVVANVESHALELWLGDGEYGRRYQNFVKNYPEIRKRSPESKSFDLRLDDRITAKEL